MIKYYKNPNSGAILQYDEETSSMVELVPLENLNGDVTITGRDITIAGDRVKVKKSKAGRKKSGLFKPEKTKKYSNKEVVMEKLAAGMAVGDISRATGVSYSTIYSIKSRMNKGDQGYKIKNPEKIDQPLSGRALEAFIEDAESGDKDDLRLAREYDLTVAQVVNLKKQHGILSPKTLAEKEEWEEEDKDDDQF